MILLLGFNYLNPGSFNSIDCIENVTTIERDALSLTSENGNGTKTWPHLCFEFSTSHIGPISVTFKR